MKKNKILTTGAVTLLLTALLLTGCGGSAEAASVNAAETTGAVTASAAATTTAAPVETTAAVTLTETAAATDSDLFTKRDLAQTADLSEATYFTVSDGETVTITEAGVYVLSGSAKEACILVEAGDEDKVQLVLDGLTIVNSDGPCILIESADKVFLTSAEGSENTLTVSGKFSGDEDAAVFSRDDLVLNGLGSVTVTSSDDGIRSNDDLKLTGGTWYVTASGSALKAHDGIYACDGVYQLTASNDGLHAEDNDDDTAGCIVIEGGSFTVSAGDDGVHATASVTVNGGTLTVSAAEGIEATQVIVNNGAVSVTARDDGINAGRKSKSLGVKIEINGGTVTVVTGSGDTDGIDSNGDLIITGGTIDVTAQSPFDYDGTCSYTGGTIIVNGVETNSVTNQMMGGGMMGGGMMGGGMMGGNGGKQGGFGGKRW